ncbi:GxxExxY protein [Neolewinella sp.]|uniref:GxxExxY protein n=1 Tax=Neolewinella sp. TaxID=2993543 RepID=UPI003B521B26
MNTNELTYEIRAAAFAVHTELGPGLLESAYEQCLVHELQMRGFSAISQVRIPLTYRGIVLGDGYRADIIVENQVLLELKAVKELEPVHHAQVLAYLRLSGLTVGLLMNFNVHRMRDGIKRFIQDT